VEEELGDLLFQIVFHAELGDERNLQSRHHRRRRAQQAEWSPPARLRDVRVNGSDDVAARWEILKRDEKGRESVTDGIVWQLPALILYTKLLRKRAGRSSRDGERSRTRAIDAVHSLSLAHVGRRRAVQLGRGEHVGRRHRGARGDAQWPCHLEVCCVNARVSCVTNTHRRSDFLIFGLVTCSQQARGEA